MKQLRHAETGPFPSKLAPRKPTMADVLKTMHEKGMITPAGGDIPVPAIKDEEIVIGPPKGEDVYPSWMTEDMKFRLKTGQFNEGDAFDPSVIQQALKDGYLKQPEAYVNPPGPTHQFTDEQYEAIKNLENQIKDNADVLRVLGVPRDTLMDLNRRHNEEFNTYKNMERNKNFFNPAVPKYEQISDRSLGLDPSKFTKKAWNPGDYNSGLAGVVDQIRKSQEVVLGPEPKELTVEEQDAYNKAKLKRLMGY